MEIVERNRMFGGWSLTVRHESGACGCPMQFTVYLPPQAEDGKVPAVYWLSGLTCSSENFTVKAGAQRYAAELGLAIVAPDTSPRGLNLPGEEDDWDFGTGAGFYVDATESPWAGHYNMFRYVTDELPALVEAEFPLVPGRRAISGHSMGGHGALVAALRCPGHYVSVSAFAPICAPTQCPWGEKAFTGYLGADRAAWAPYDATSLVRASDDALPLFVDVGDADGFLHEQLKPELLEAACMATARPLTLRRQPGYNHSYYFIATFIGEHLAYHARAMK